MLTWTCDSWLEWEASENLAFVFPLMCDDGVIQLFRWIELFRVADWGSRVFAWSMSAGLVIVICAWTGMVTLGIKQNIAAMSMSCFIELG
jgi:hypothetical protein